MRSGNISDTTTTTTFKRLSADDQRLIAGVTQQWEEDGNEIRLTGSAEPYHPGPQSTDEEKAAYWQPCPSGSCPKSSCTGAGKDFYTCCGVSFFNGWLALIICPACLATYCTSVVTCIAGGLLFVCFAAAMAQALLRGIVTECGCFGSLTRTRVSRMLVARNAVVVVMLFLEAASKRPWVLVTGRGDAVVLTAAGCVALAAAALTGAQLSRAHRRRTSAPPGPSAPPSSSSSVSGARI